MAKILGVHIPVELKNIAINGALDLWQRVEANTTTVNTATTTVNRTADMIVAESSGATVKNYSIARSTDVPTLAQSGFNSTYSYLFTMITGIASPAAGDYVIPFEYRVEGFDYEKIHSKVVTFGFWVKASVSGTYSFALTNAAANRTYVTTFTVNAGSTWEFKSITVTLDNTGTWLFDINAALSIYIGAISGATFQTSSLGSWQAAALISASTSTNWQATNGATFQVAQFSIVEGPLGFSATGFSRQGKTIGQEILAAQRYYYKSYPQGVAPGAADTNWPFQYRAKGTAQGEVVMQFAFPTLMRLGPSNIVVTVYNPSTGGTGSLRDVTTNANVSSELFGVGANGAGISNLNSVINGSSYVAHITAEAGM